ncbi:glycosyl hydrolase [Flavobacterium sp. GSA192]|uniref:glycosyl hydrolase n=1 Tax=Flavobacterium sp. GSA192 TaxID=2576304 RepID=UPI00112AA81C|nr:glycosyl hydrolase [Flavobacterium sp. GSA192]
MKRRAFIEQISLGGAAMMLLPSGFSFASTKPLDSAELAEFDMFFKNPPNSSKPWVFWQWMNGNISKEGITLDLEAMQRMGIGGALCFNNAVGIPRGAVDYASEEWLEMVHYATAECQRLGMLLMLHNGAGYSGSGGPWITPEMSMQQLVWTEKQVKDSKNIAVDLLQPQAKEGYYCDAYVLAYPSLSVENGTMREQLNKMFLDGKQIDKTILLDQDSNSKIRMEPTKQESAVLLLEFKSPFEARSITITRKPEEPKDLFDGPRDYPPKFILEASVDGILYTEVCTFNTPELREMDTPAMQNFEAVKAKYFRLLTKEATWLSSIELSSGPRLAGWPGKANWTHGSPVANQPEVEQGLLIHPEQVIDVTSFLTKEGRLHWNAPKKTNWTLVRIGHTTTGEMPAAHPDSAAGLEVDKFSIDAVNFHYEKFLSKIIKKLDPYTGKAFQGFTTDSWEAGKQNWSLQLPEEFHKKRGYEIGAWLLTMTGRIVGSVEESERFLWDMNKTQAELLSENYYGHMQKLCHQHNLQYHAESYGDGNLDSLQAGQYLDVPMAEFWTRYIYGSEMTSKQAASIGHAYGKKVVAAEAFTGMPLTSKWTEYPYSLKAEGDFFYTLGINRLVFHVFVHQPYTTGFPGMTMGPFGTHFDRNNTWTEQAYGWINHVRRAQYLLQQGLSVVDVCYFKGDEAVSGIPDLYANGYLPAGYRGDVIGRDALLTRFMIDNGKIVLPDGMQYKVCILASVKGLMPETAQRIKELVAQGMVLIVQNKPEKSLGLLKGDLVVQNTINELYGTLDGVAVKRSTFGKGKLFWGIPLNEVFQELNIEQDFYYTAAQQDATIHYTHKKLEDKEFFFVSNHKRRKEVVSCSFRISGFAPELWDSETGDIIQAPLYEIKDGRTHLTLEFEPAGAYFVVFRKKITASGFDAIAKDGQLLLSTKAFEKPQAGKYKEVINDFAISFWAKPDTYAHNGKSMFFHPLEGEKVFGKGHATCGISLGQNGVKVYECASGKSTLVLESLMPIAGWTHFALAYKNGKPQLYINGIFDKEGTASLYKVHPGIESIPNPNQFSSYFEGNGTKPVLHLSNVENKIQSEYQKGLPDLDLISPLIFTNKSNTFLFTQNGEYEFSGKKTAKIVIKDCKQQPIETKWQVQFSGKAGIPNPIELDKLKSLRFHDDFEVKHFSGTATYFNSIHLKKADFIEGRKLLLDLGRVEVIAKLFVNGKEVSLLWKEPYWADITAFVKSGENEIRIEVTNLWSNRLIGDEWLPAENKFSKHKFIEKLPDWYVHNGKKPGDRKAFSVWKNFERTEPLLESGLLGPVKLNYAMEKKI